MAPRKKFAHTKYTQEKTLGPRNNHEKKKLGPTKYTRRHDDAMALDPRDAQWNATHEI